MKLNFVAYVRKGGDNLKSYWKKKHPVSCGSGLSERCILVFAAQSAFIHAIVKAFHTLNGSVIYLHKSILPPFHLSFVATRILNFLC